MIDRYSRSEMSQIWAQKSRFDFMLKVEIAVAQAQADLGLIPKKAALDIQKKSKFNVERILEIEKVTKHDVIAFVSNVAENIGPNGRYVHFGMTSSDVLDTAFSVQVGEASRLLLDGLLNLKKTFTRLIEKHRMTLCAGRTHGMFAEPTTFGFKLTGYYAELCRNEKRIKEAINQFKICKLSGAVGTYSSQSILVEAKVAKKLGLKVETLATQVIPRDRHAEVLSSLALLGSGLERLAIELRHLQRSEVAEVIEGFSPGQKGSSAMPHKKNPISAENITGLSRLLKSYAIVGLENVALWHERDISHSSAERVVFPDAFILADYMVDRMNTLLSGLYVDEKRMKENIHRGQGMLFSSHVLLDLVKKGLSREDAYKTVQRISHALKPGEQLSNVLLHDSETKKILKKADIDAIFSGKKHFSEINKVITKALKERL